MLSVPTWTWSHRRPSQQVAGTARTKPTTTVTVEVRRVLITVPRAVRIASAVELTHNRTRSIRTLRWLIEVTRLVTRYPGWPLRG